MTDRVIELTDADVRHPFEGDPYVAAPHRTRIDPFPCYAHDVGLVAGTLRKVDRIVGKRVLVKPTVYVLHHDTPSRINGWAMADWIYPRPKDGPEWRAIVVLPGKRIPIHPAMTRYVVAHEYGHHVEHELLRRRGLKPDASNVTREYAELRGLDPDIPYGGRTWHASPGELLANDFRILVCGIEPEFWPHPGYAHPSRSPAVKRWWETNL